MKSRILLLSLFSITWVLTNAQNYSREIGSGKLTIEGNSFEGYKGFFDFPAKDVEYGWWKYCRQFGKPLNMRKYYQVTIPRRVDGSDVEIVIYAKAIGLQKQETRFILVLDDQSIPNDKKSAYLNQLKQVLKEFKQRFYINYYVKKLESIQGIAAKQSQLVQKLKGDHQKDVFAELQLLAFESNRIKEKLRSLQ